MPKVGKRHFPYSEAGEAAAEKEATKTGLPMTRRKPQRKEAGGKIAPGYGPPPRPTKPGMPVRPTNRPAPAPPAARPVKKMMHGGKAGKKK